MNRFIRQDSSLEQTVKQIVKGNFPAVDIATLSGLRVEDFAENSMSKLPGGAGVTNIVETDGTSSKRLMLWTTSRWGGSHVTR